MNRLLVPGIAADDERRHGFHRALDAGRIGGAGAFAPADEAVVRRELHDDVGDAAAVDERAGLDPLVGDARNEGFELGDFHGQCSTPENAAEGSVLEWSGA